MRKELIKNCYFMAKMYALLNYKIDNRKTPLKKLKYDIFVAY